MLPPASPSGALRALTFNQFRAGGNKGRLLQRLQQQSQAQLRADSSSGGGGSANNSLCPRQPLEPQQQQQRQQRQEPMGYGQQDVPSMHQDEAAGFPPADKTQRRWEARGGAYFLVPVGGDESSAADGGE